MDRDVTCLPAGKRKNAVDGTILTCSPASRPATHHENGREGAVIYKPLFNDIRAIYIYCPLLGLPVLAPTLVAGSSAVRPAVLETAP